MLLVHAKDTHRSPYNTIKFIIQTYESILLQQNVSKSCTDFSSTAKKLFLHFAPKNRFFLHDKKLFLHFAVNFVQFLMKNCVFWTIVLHFSSEQTITTRISVGKKFKIFARLYSKHEDLHSHQFSKKSFHMVFVWGLFVPRWKQQNREENTVFH